MKKKTFAIAAVASALLASSMVALVACDKGNNGGGGDDTPTGGTYTITLNANGGTLSGNSTLTTVNGKIATMPTDPTKTNSTFVGWYLNAAGTGSQVTTSTSFTSDSTIYAKWNDAQAGTTYTITIDANGGELVSGQESTLETGTDGTLAALPALTAATKSGYTLTGWADADGVAVTTSTVFTANSTIYAQWTADLPEVDPNENLTYEECTGPNDVYLVGAFQLKGATSVEDFVWDSGYTFTTNPNAANDNALNEFMLLKVYLTEGDIVKIRANWSNDGGSGEYGTGYDQCESAADKSFMKDEGSTNDEDVPQYNIEITQSGYYNFYFKEKAASDKVWVEQWTEPAEE